MHEIWYYFLSFVIAQSQFYSSQVELTDFGEEFQTFTSTDLISTTNNTKTQLRCAMYCNLNPQCTIFDYDSATLRCRLFRNSVNMFGQAVSSTSATSIVGSILYTPELFLEKNQSCEKCETNRYLTCDMTTLTCQCPPNFYWVDNMCLAY
ncbi:unnamed protein product [Didymodactylos carnosus]|uniref:Apple domain-containing protein n=1 Tax=Didymodactylos carnosus TaxID=1234261 RepID=A0A8S2FCT4_9BILA|nr:unnamed protein product [Didymodactylos carnosus]CAF4227014.1 unnamed protein product [Didymodactylos carnosus]